MRAQRGGAAAIDPNPRVRPRGRWVPRRSGSAREDQPRRRRRLREERGPVRAADTGGHASLGVESDGEGGYLVPGRPVCQATCAPPPFRPLSRSCSSATLAGSTAALAARCSWPRRRRRRWRRSTWVSCTRSAGSAARRQACMPWAAACGGSWGAGWRGRCPSTSGWSSRRRKTAVACPAEPARPPACRSRRCVPRRIHESRGRHCHPHG